MPSQSRPSFFHHLHPPSIPAQQARFRYTLAAGGISLFLVIILIITGMLEMFYYVPTPDEAGASVQAITYLVPFGATIRNLHFWAAQGLVLTVVIHMLRVIFTGAYAPPRRFNYLLGLSLLIITFLMDFTGYVLRWDEGIRWALVAGTNLVRSIPIIGTSLYGMVVGGNQPGPATLTRFYAWHIFGLTLVLVFLSAWHMFRVRRDGGIAVAPPEQRSTSERITRFELVRREVLVMLIAMAVLLLIAAIFPAPIAPAMTFDDPSANLADSRAPWFFLWVQELLKWGSSFWMGVMVPVGVLLILALLPFLLPNADPAELGRWFPSRSRLAQILIAIIGIIILALTVRSVLSG